MLSKFQAINIVLLASLSFEAICLEFEVDQEIFRFISQVVNLCHLVVERLLKVAIRLDVAFHGFQSFNTFDILCDEFVLSEEFAVSQPLNLVANLQKVEVEILDFAAKQILFLAQVANKRRNFCLSLLIELCSIFDTSIAGTREGTLYIFQVVVKLVHLTFLLRASLEKLRAVISCDVDHYGKWIGELNLVINEIRDRWEVKTQGILDTGPALDREIRGVTLLILNLNIRML